jgi:hypothetical protein
VFSEYERAWASGRVYIIETTAVPLENGASVALFRGRRWAIQSVHYLFVFMLESRAFEWPVAELLD